jgi:DNA-binding winged helix-turn-helix (wHTH) protein
VATRALQLLVENRHRLVSRNDLRRHLWGDAALEWEAGIYQVIRQLRRALGDDPRTRAFIATIPRRGYRWTAPVTAVEPRIGPGRPDAPGRSDAAAGSPSRSAPRPLHHRLPGARRWNRIGLFLAGAASLPLAVLLACLVAGLAR